MDTRLKDGDPLQQQNYRLLCIKNAQGLLQEDIIVKRARSRLWESIQPEQSGYDRPCDDPLLVAHELTADRQAKGLPTWILMGDMVRAFPRTWRAALLR